MPFDKFKQQLENQLEKDKEDKGKKEMELNKREEQFNKEFKVLLSDTITPAVQEH